MELSDARLYLILIIDHLYQTYEIDKKFFLHYGDLSDSMNLVRIIQEIKPDEIYNLAAQSHVAVSFESPEYTADTVGLGALRILDAIKYLALKNRTKFYQASTSELYGDVQEIPQKESTPFILVHHMQLQGICILDNH